MPHKVQSWEVETLLSKVEEGELWTQRQLIEMTGLRQESVSAVLIELQRQGIVRECELDKFNLQTDRKMFNFIRRSEKMNEQKQMIEKQHSVKFAINAKGLWSAEVKVYGSTPDEALVEASKIAKLIEITIKGKNEIL